jgi:hypothetical protein
VGAAIVPSAGGFAGWIVQWLRTQRPPELEAWAAADTAMVPLLLRQWPGPPEWALRAVRALLGPRALDAARRLGPREFREILQIIMDAAPEHGIVLWAHEAWYQREMAALRDALCGPTQQEVQDVRQ